MRKMFSWLAVVVVTIALFDVLAYLLLPISLTAAMPGYRQPALATIGHGAYPRHYFESHDERGFDLRPGATGQHHVEGRSYGIWANDLGCYDDQDAIDGDYIYLAGDSYLWGYIPHDAHFERMLSAASDANILNCGVGHSGQHHQLSKYRDVTKKIGRAPGTVLLFYAANDVANDHAFPHSTVIDGWLVDRKKLDGDFNPITLDDATLEARMAHLRKSDRNGLKSLLKRHSATAHIGEALTDRIFHAGAAADGPALQSLYALAKQNHSTYRYTDVAHASSNKEALRRFKAQAEADGARLVTILIPPKEHVTDPAFYRELEAFLDAEAIEHLNLAHGFGEGAFTADDLYYAADPHFHDGGHQAVAALLIDAFPDLFPRKNP